MQARYRAWLLFLTLLLGACSALSLAYMNAPRLGTYWINRALDLPDAQRAVLADAAEEVYRWHLGEPRRELAALLREAQRRAGGRLGQSDGDWLVEALQEHVRGIGEQLALRLPGRMPAFSTAELKRMAARLAARREQYAKEIAAGDPVRERKLRLERLEEIAEDWLGPISTEQRNLIRDSAAASGFDARLWIDERARREAALVEALGAADGGERLRQWFVDWRSGRSAEAAARLDRQQRATIALWVALLNGAADEQRRHLRARLGDWAEVFEHAAD